MRIRFGTVCDTTRYDSPMFFLSSPAARGGAEARWRRWAPESLFAWAQKQHQARQARQAPVNGIKTMLCAECPVWGASAASSFQWDDLGRVGLTL
jgi:hypothetical protein